MGMFDDLIPSGAQAKGGPPAQQEAGAGRGGMFDDLIPRQDGQRTSPVAPQPTETPNIYGSMLIGHENTLAAAKQGTNPSVYHGDGKYLRTPLGEISAEGDMGLFYKGQDGKDALVDPEKHVVLIDPASGRPTVFQRTKEWDEGPTAGVSRIMTQGMLPGPIAMGQGRAVALGTPQLGAYSAARAAEAVEDLAAAERLNVPMPGVVFSSKPVRGLAKSLEETPLIGAPLHNSVQGSYQGMADAVERIATELSPITTFDQAGQSLQTGLDRFRTAGINKIEPPILEGMGVSSTNPIAPRSLTSTDAARRARAAEGIAPNIGADVVETSRGAQVPPPLPSNEIFRARTTAEALSNNELARIIRAPASETSFAARQEALYERAFRNLPELYRADGSANPNMFSTPNAALVARGMMEAEQAAGITGGILEGRFGNLVSQLSDANRNFSLDSLRAARTEIGRALSNFGQYDARLDRTQLRTLYGAVSQDIEMGMRDLANRAVLGTRPDQTGRGMVFYGGPNREAVTQEAARAAVQALRDYRVADRYTRTGIQRMDNFMSVLNADNPERAAQRLIQAAQEGGRGNINLVNTAVSALRPDERADIAALLLRSMGRPVPSARGIAQETGFSPQSFTTRWAALDPRAREMLFGGPLNRAINDLNRVSNRMANLESLANVSRSGVHAMNVGGLFAGIASLWSGTFAPIAAAAGTGAMMSVILSRPEYARWATQYMRLKAAAIQSPQKVNAALITHVNRLSQMATRDASLVSVLRAAQAENGIVQGRDGNGQQGSEFRTPKKNGGKAEPKDHANTYRRSDNQMAIGPSVDNAVKVARKYS